MESSTSQSQDQISKSLLDGMTYKLPLMHKQMLANNPIIRKNLLMKNKYGSLNKVFMNQMIQNSEIIPKFIQSNYKNQQRNQRFNSTGVRASQKFINVNDSSKANYKSFIIEKSDSHEQFIQKLSEYKQGFQKSQSYYISNKNNNDNQDSENHTKLPTQCSQQVKTENYESKKESIKIKPNKQNKRKQSQEESKNQNSKFNEIQQLKYEKKLLEMKVKLLEEELQSGNEFQQALQFNTDNNQTGRSTFNEERVNLLKSQIHKQQRHIRLLSRNLKLFRSLYIEMKSFLEWLIKVHSKFETIDIPTFVSTQEESIEMVRRIYNSSLDSTSNENALRQVNQMNKDTFIQTIIYEQKNNPDFKDFYENFNKAFEQVEKLKTEQEQMNFLFTFSQGKQFEKNRKKEQKQINNAEQQQLQKNLKYRYPLKYLIDKYKNCFNIQTIYSALSPIQTKVQFDDFLKKITLTSNEINKSFFKISFQKYFSQNPFFYRDQCETLKNQNQFYVEHLNDLENYLTDSIQLKVDLNYNEIMNTEKSLSLLFNELLTFQQNIITDKSCITMQSIQHLNDIVKKSAQNLLMLGLATNADQLEVVMTNSNLVENYYTNLQKKSNLYEKQQNQELVYIYEKNYESQLNYLKLSEETKKEIESIRQFNVHGHELNNNLISISLMVSKLEKIYQQNYVYSIMSDLELNYFRQTFVHIKRLFNKVEEFIQEKIQFFKQVASNGFQNLDSIETYLTKQCEGNKNDIYKSPLYHAKLSINNLRNLFLQLSIEKSFEERTLVKGIYNEFLELQQQLKSVWSYFNKHNE